MNAMRMETSHEMNFKIYKYGVMVLLYECDVG